jgi:hypothetical protein
MGAASGASRDGSGDWHNACEPFALILCEIDDGSLRSHCNGSAVDPTILIWVFRSLVGSR